MTNTCRENWHKKTLLTIYHALRRETFVLGATDKEYPRATPSIKNYEELAEIDYGRLVRAVREEIGIIALCRKNTDFEIEALEREKENLEAMVNRATEVYGIDRRNLKPR